jgi:hypothetical protein
MNHKWHEPVTHLMISSAEIEATSRLRLSSPKSLETRLTTEGSASEGPGGAGRESRREESSSLRRAGRETTPLDQHCLLESHRFNQPIVIPPYVNPLHGPQ